MSRGGEVAKAESCDFFATTSADGRVLFWPTELTKNPKTKLMEWAPSHECKMTRGEVAGILQAISLDFIDLDAGKSTFWATGMAGEVAQCDFKMREDDETVPMDASRMVSHFHEGPVRSLERSPFFPDVALSVGNWTFKLFAEGSRMPIFSAPTSDVYLSVGAFSPTRPGVVYIAKSSGEIDVWDFTSKSQARADGAGVQRGHRMYQVLAQARGEEGAAPGGWRRGGRVARHGAAPVLTSRD